MLLRFVVKNLFSFKEQTEFNLFPNKTTRLPHHKVEVNGVPALRLTAIYGANGSGKSNLIKAINALKTMIREGVIDTEIEKSKYKLSQSCKDKPIELAIEFSAHEQNYYYTISIEQKQVIYEYLAESKNDKDILIFERKILNDIQTIKFSDSYSKDDKNKLFASILEEKILEKNQLLFSFLSKKYENDFTTIKNAYNWFDNSLAIISPDSSLAGFAHILDSNFEMDSFANELISSFNTGITKLGVDTKNVEEFFSEPSLSDGKEIKNLITNLAPNSAASLMDKNTGEEILVVNENDNIVTKRLYTEHTDENSNQVKFTIPEESDGTRRLLDFVPVLQNLVKSNRVFLIDEIERSIHPLTIKEIISKFSLDEQAKGQLIFTTHESCLLDQDILRPDEIWFCQKDFSGATKLYSLSDYKVHNTIDIENGYLSGRYGGIPFLSNLHDLNWHKYTDVK